MKPDVALKAAIDKEVVDGDLKAAIEMYRTLAEQKADRAVAAKALMRMGQCYEKLGTAQTAESRKAYQRLVRDFADQKDVADQARARLAALGAGGPLTMTARRVATVSDWGDFGSAALSPDGRRLAFADFMRRRLTILDLTTGEERTAGAPSFAKRGGGLGGCLRSGRPPAGRSVDRLREGNGRPDRHRRRAVRDHGIRSGRCEAPDDLVGHRRARRACSGSPTARASSSP